MSAKPKASDQIMESLDELICFARGENTEPMSLFVPDGMGGLTKHEVANMDEYRAACLAEGLRVISEIAPLPPPLEDRK